VQGVDHEDMSTYFNAADVLLLTSRREGSPNVVKEALACNLPVVSTDVGDVRERVDGVTASLVSDDDADLAAGVADAVQAEDTTDGREAAREVGRERCTERLLDVYRSVLDGA